MAQQGQNESGFTLIEVIVVITLIGIITAALIPQFWLINVRSRMKVDISSVKVLQEQINLYEINYDKLPGTTLESMIQTLVSEDMINSKYIDAPVNRLYLNTDGASICYDWSDSHVKLVVPAQLYSVYQDNQEKSIWMKAQP